MNYSIEYFMGYVEIVHTYREEGNTVICGSYAVHRNLDGTEHHRTENTESGQITFPDDCWNMHYLLPGYYASQRSTSPESEGQMSQDKGRPGE